MVDLTMQCKFGADGAVSGGQRYGLGAVYKKAAKYKGFCTVSPYRAYKEKIRQIRQSCRWRGETSSLSPSTVQLHLGADTAEIRCRYDEDSAWQKTF
jgi:hypothetical protein